MQKQTQFLFCLLLSLFFIAGCNRLNDRTEAVQEISLQPSESHEFSINTASPHIVGFSLDKPVKTGEIRMMQLIDGAETYSMLAMSNQGWAAARWEPLNRQLNFKIINESKDPVKIRVFKSGHLPYQ